MSEKAADLNDVVRELRDLRVAFASTKTELLTREQTAELLGVSPATIDRMRAAEEIPAPIMLRGAVRWRRADLQKFIESL